MTDLARAVLNVLRSSPQPLHVQDIYSRLKKLVPNLCDDKIIPCPYCKQNHPLWQHKAAWSLQTLKQEQLAFSPKRAYWQASKKTLSESLGPAIDFVKPQQNPVIEEPEMPNRVEEPTLHATLKTQIKEIGTIFGKYAKEEYSSQPYIYDVIWKEAEGLPRPCHVFEVQDKGQVDTALAKL
jgi:hypothetical protein